MDRDAYEVGDKKREMDRDAYEVGERKERWIEMPTRQEGEKEEEREMDRDIYEVGGRKGRRERDGQRYL